jgi:cyclophilin family peptidyl-prolyl cis-trans isomerase
MLMNMRTEAFFGLGLLLILVLVLCAGCGDSDEPSSGDGGNSDSETNGADTGNDTNNEDSREISGELVIPTSYDSPLTRIAVKTNHGEFTLELDKESAPYTTQNFLNYVQTGFYNNVLIDQVEVGEVVYGGSFNSAGEEKLTNHTVPNEADNGKSNVRGTISMFRDPARKDSATNRFFINLSDHGELDHQDETHEGFGYCVFGRVIVGMEIVDAIAQVSVEERDGALGWPVEPVVIESMRIE